VVAHQGERLVYRDVTHPGQGSLGLFDGDSGVEGALQLFGEDLAVGERSLLQQADGGDVGEGLDDVEVVGLDPSGGGAEQVEGPDDGVAVPQREGMNRAVSGGDRLRREPGPAARRRGTGRC
jgi:hypothetical protein